MVRQPIHVLFHEWIVGLHRDVFAVHRPKRLGMRQRVAEHDDGVEVAVLATHGGVAQQRVVVFGHVHGVGTRPGREGDALVIEVSAVNFGGDVVGLKGLVRYIDPSRHGLEEHFFEGFGRVEAHQDPVAVTAFLQLARAGIVEPLPKPGREHQRHVGVVQAVVGARGDQSLEYARRARPGEPSHPQKRRLWGAPRLRHRAISRRISRMCTWGWFKSMRCRSWSNAEWLDAPRPEAAVTPGRVRGKKKASVPPAETATRPCQDNKRSRNPSP